MLPSWHISQLEIDVKVFSNNKLTILVLLSMCVHSLKPQPEGGVKNWIYNALLTEFAIVFHFF